MLVDADEYSEWLDEERRRNLHQADKDAANLAVRNAMADFRNQPWYWTVVAKARFGLYWATYWLRLQLAIFGVMRLGWDDKRTWRRLAL